MTCERCAELEAEIVQLRAQLEAPIPPQPEAAAPDVRQVFDYWVRHCNHPRAKLTQDRRSKVRARLREGYTVTDLKQAVQGAAKGAYIDSRGHKWDDLSLICRSGSNVERFIAIYNGSVASLDARRKFLGG